MKYLVLAASLVSLSACNTSQGGGVGFAESPLWHATASNEVKTAYFVKQCEGFGFKPGTPEIANCAMRMAGESKAASSQRMQTSLNNMQMNMPRQPVNCHATHTQFGRTVNSNVNCY